jgi:hypothetical protein
MMIAMMQTALPPETVAKVLAFLFVSFAVFCLLVFWVYRDAEARGQPGYLVVMLIMATGFTVGLLLWLLFRPKKIADSEEYLPDTDAY